MSRFKAVFLVAVLGFCAPAALAVEASPLTDAQKTAVEAVVRDLLTKKEPEIVMKAAQELQDKAERDASVKGQAAVLANKDKLFNDPASPIGGNPKGDVTIVEFFDYTCGYCKMVHNAVTKFVGEDKNVRIVYKEFPILGPGAVFASRAALAVAAQGKYEAFHNALMATKERVTEDVAKKVAKNVGVNVDKMLNDMKSDKIEAMVKANHDLAQALHIQGTPAFVIGETLHPGALSAEQMKTAVEAARGAGKK